MTPQRHHFLKRWLSHVIYMYTNATINHHAVFKTHHVLRYKASDPPLLPVVNSIVLLVHATITEMWRNCITNGQHSCICDREVAIDRAKIAYYIIIPALPLHIIDSLNRCPPPKKNPQYTWNYLLWGFWWMHWQNHPLCQWLLATSWCSCRSCCSGHRARCPSARQHRQARLHWAVPSAGQPVLGSRETPVSVSSMSKD